MCDPHSIFVKMEKSPATDFVVIDDEPMSIRICEIVISRIFPEFDLQTFSDPEKGYQHLATAYASADANNVIVFLDLMMPVMNGWQVLDKINELPDEVKRRMNIYILSSSPDQADINRADENPSAKKFIRKPLLINTLRKQIDDGDFL
jgi:CheY-like chemotaxis protein